LRAVSKTTILKNRGENMRKLLGILTVLGLAVLACWVLLRVNEELPYSYAYSQDGYIYTSSANDQARATRKALAGCKSRSSKPHTCVSEPWNKEVCIAILYCANDFFQRTIKKEGKTMNEAEINAIRARPTGHGELICSFRYKLCPPGKEK
jgi:hypothetical protein